MNHEAQTIQAVEMIAWATLEDPAMTMEEGRAELEAAGNKILEVDSQGRRFKVAHVTVERNEDGSWPFPDQA